jgi:ppGpp synthetase/RelA/SpoT-type nucleotidyltranferase
MQTNREYIEYRLLSEYSKSYPTYKKIRDKAEAIIKYNLIDSLYKKKNWERIEVISRIKEVESAINKLKRKREGRTLEESDTLATLTDMVGLKIRVFPNDYLEPIGTIIKNAFPIIEEDHEPQQEYGIDEKDYYADVIRLKYIASFKNNNINFEIQIVPFILDAFYEIDHDIIYKPDTKLPNPTLIARLMKEPNQNIVAAIKIWSKSFSYYFEKYGR